MREMRDVRDVQPQLRSTWRLSAILLAFLPFLTLQLPLGQREGMSLHYFILISLAALSMMGERLVSRHDPWLAVLVVVLCGSMIISGVYSNYPSQTPMMIAYMALAITVAVLVTRAPVTSLSPVRVACLGSTVAAVVSLAQLSPLSLFISPLVPAKPAMALEWGYRRLRGSIGDYELLAECLAIGIVFTLVWFSNTTNWKLRIGLVISLAAQGTALLLTGTRSGFVTATLGLILLAIFSSVTLGRAVRRIIAVSLFVSLFAWLTISLHLPIVERFSEAAAGSTIEETINRAQVWNIFDTRMGVDPSFIGIGPRYPFEVVGVFPHSGFKSLLLLGGLPALVAAIGLIALVLVAAFRAMRFKRDVLSVSFVVVPVMIVGDQLKVEATRSGPYMIWLVVLLVLIRIGARSFVRDDCAELTIREDSVQKRKLQHSKASMIR
jgi:hypothetical protein